MTDAPRRYVCSDTWRAHGEPVHVTASQVQAWLAVEVPGAWGRDAPHDSDLGRSLPDGALLELKRRGVRTINIRRRRDATTLTAFTAGVARPGRPTPTLWRRSFTNFGEITDIAAGLSADALRTPTAPGPDWQPAERQFFICTNGRHDQCCAVRGRPMVRALAQSEYAHRVWECSHIGGDRFAPNLLTLPGSLYFGRFDDADPAELLRTIDSGHIVLRYFRGRTAYRGAEQAVEQAVLDHALGHLAEMADLDGVTVDGQGHGMFRASFDGRTYRLKLRGEMVGHDDPLTCQGPPGQTARRFVVESFVADDALPTDLPHGRI